MSELRQDPFTGRWTVIAPGRTARPNDHARPPAHDASAGDCPFCEGREDRTPPETAAVRPDGGPPNGRGWTVRAIPNRFPTLATPTDPPHALPPETGGSGQVLPGRGWHEVIIESPRHAPGLPELPPAQLAVVFRFLRERVRSLEARRGIAAAVLFENWGPESGGTLWHPHAQIVATEELPPRLFEERARFVAPGPPGESGCRLEAVADWERRAKARLLADDPEFTTLAPFGSEHPYELRLVPRRHAGSFADASDAEVDRLAVLLPALLRSLTSVVPAASYNWVVHGLPLASDPSRAFHWHVELLPRIVRPDGFELGAGIEVNPVLPEIAASQLGAALGPALAGVVEKL